MSEMRDDQKAAQAARAVLNEAEETLCSRRNQLRYRQNLLADILRQGKVGSKVAPMLQREIRALEGRIARDLKTFNTAKAHLARTLEVFPQLDRPWELVEKLNDNLPFLLFPVRIETRFITVTDHKELWVRIFPDDIAVHTHEKTLAGDEVNAGKTYWRELWTASQETDEAARQKIEKGAWRALAEAYGSTRAAWIASETKPVTLEVANVHGLEFPAFDPETLKEESWSQAPRSNIMPDQFVVMAYADGKEILREAGNLIPSPLIMGPDPQKLEDEYRQQNGELLVGEDIEWIYNFDTAVKVGLGFKVPLKGPLKPFANSGFDRLLVLGLRLSSDEHGNQSLLEALFESHHHSPDGMSLLPQGTPTNNTESKGSGFSSEDPGAETSYAVETGDVLFETTDKPFEKSDGQRIAEALGISHKLFQHIQYADQSDVRETMLMNKVLWPGTLGYYLEDLLEFDLMTIEHTREFFTDYVSGRGPLPAIRVGTQPYGVLLTSDYSAWKWSQAADGDKLSFLEQLHKVGSQAEATWRDLATEVPHVGAPGDPYENLLSLLGLHATSVDYHRRHAVGKEYIWNYEVFNRPPFFAHRILPILDQWSRSLRQELDIDFADPPKLFDLTFFRRQDELTDPLVDDIPADEAEKLSETRGLKSRYGVPNPVDANANVPTNYIGWLLYSAFDDVKSEHFENPDGELVDVPPRPLLYRLLRGALLQAQYEATMGLYTTFGLLPLAARREVELSNVQTDRTVTRWEFMDADISRVMPELSQQSQSIGQFLQTEDGLSRPESLSLREVRECLEALIDVPTARLERLFAEHLDLCSYRLDAWQMGCFNRRLQQQRFPVETEGAFEARVQGIYLGAFGWVEDLRPAPELVPVDTSAVPASLHDPKQDGPLFEQPDNGGFIHGPSLNHAVAAAVLRNAYITHFDPDDQGKMAVNLSSERVRTALAFLEGIRNGQELGALLGYQFERGLHDRHGDPSLNQYIPLFRQQYPMVADKITPDEEDEHIETKEARNVFDGYALLEVTFLRDEEEREEYPYGIEGLPDPELKSGKAAIVAEVSRMADTLDAIADLALAEGVYQVTQGNFDRAGAMLKALTEGNNPVEPEIVRTPRSGSALTQRVTLHLATGGGITSPWPGLLSERAKMEPGLNKWLGDLLPSPDKIQYAVRLGDSAPEQQNLASLGLQPIDLVYLIGDDLADETTELESRIAYENRRNVDDDSLAVRIEFMADLADPEGITLFALLPLLRAQRELVTGSRPLAADDFGLPSETTSSPAEDANPKGYDLVELQGRVEVAFTAFTDAVHELGNAIPDPDADGNRDLALADAEELRRTLLSLAAFGVPDAIPLSAIGASDEAKSLLVNQAVSIRESVDQKLIRAEALKTAGNETTLTAEARTARYREAAQAIFGPAFNPIPVFKLKDPGEIQAAVDFRDAGRALSLTRHHQDNPHIVAEWLQGVARVREKVGTLESVLIFGEALGRFSLDIKPLQLPFREQDHWVAVEYPEVKSEDVDKPDAFVPEGDFLSLVQWLPSSSFTPGQPQSGLLVDEWLEVIPGKRETTGIAVHYNQPSTEPPQVVLLAVTPEITGAWTWDKLAGILNDTLNRAKRRAVEPDQLGNGAFGHLLPAVISAVTSYPFATISTDFVHQTAVNAANLTADNG